MCRKMQRDDFQIPKRINWDSLLNLLHKVRKGESRRLCLKCHR